MSLPLVTANPCGVTVTVTPYTSSFSVYTGLLEAEPLSYLLVPSKGPILFRVFFPSLDIGGGWACVPPTIQHVVEPETPITASGFPLHRLQ